MNRKNLLKYLASLMFFIFVADLLARYFYWYFSVWYFDMFMHFLGGLWTGLFFIWLCFVKDIPLPFWLSRFFNLDNIKIIYHTAVFVVLVGILWEVFEFFANNYIGQESFNIVDTTSDMFFDLSGGLVALLFFVIFNHKHRVQFKDDF